MRNTATPSVIWMVKGSGPSNVTHDSKRSAEMEAARLATANPGQTFYVMKAVTAYRKEAAERFSLDGHDEYGETPF